MGNLKYLSNSIKEKGFVYSFKRMTTLSINYLIFQLRYKLSRSTNEFSIQGNKYHYFHSLNTWENERCIEIPIIRSFIGKNIGKNILEIGNVFSNYYPFNHDIVDKYEEAKSVINHDVVDFSTNKRYNLIFSISTLEHVGFDEQPKDSTKILRSIENLISLLEIGGKIIITLPLGYNLEMDKMISESKIPFTEVFYMKRVSKDNQWLEVREEDVMGIKYNFPFKCANALLIGIIEPK